MVSNSCRSINNEQKTSQFEKKNDLNLSKILKTDNVDLNQ